MNTLTFRQELNKLKTFATQPGAASAGLQDALNNPQAHPDVQRILEGVAYLTAGIRDELDSQFPRLLTSLAQHICPQYLRPLPSSTVIAFEPKASLLDAQTAAKGTYIDSKAKNGISCRFKTTQDVELLPLSISNITKIDATSEQGAKVRVDFKMLSGMTLDAVAFSKLRFFLADEYSEAADLFFLLSQHLQAITITANGSVNLPTKALSQPLVDPRQSIYPQKLGMMPSYDLLQQYFLSPAHYLFLDLDLSHWQSRGAGSQFSIEFQLEKTSHRLGLLTNQSIQLFATPAVNLFEQDSKTVMISNDENQYKLLPNGPQTNDSTEIYQINSLRSIARGAEQARDYALFAGFSERGVEGDYYELVYQGTQDNPDIAVKLVQSQHNPLQDKEMLSAQLTCSNGQYANKLLIGEISVATENSPELATFKNIVAPTQARRLPLESKRLWQLISNLSLNYLSLTDAEQLKALLSQYIAPDHQDLAGKIANEKKLKAISKLRVNQQETLYKGHFIHGQQVSLTIKPEGFASFGDMYVFGAVLDAFMASMAPVNVFSQLQIIDETTGSATDWAVNLGDKAFI